nr:cathepsin D-like [Drosophila bipectinata]
MKWLVLFTILGLVLAAQAGRKWRIARHVAKKVAIHVIKNELRHWAGDVVNYKNGSPVYQLPAFGDDSYDSDEDSELKELNVNQISIDGAIVSGSVKAISSADSDTLLVAPAAAYAQINQLIGAVFVDGQYYVQCSSVKSLPVITFNIGGTNYEVPSSVYIETTTEGKVTSCTSTFTYIGTDFWILGGDVFQA